MPIVFSVVLAVIAVWAIWQAVRAGGATGWAGAALIVIAAAAQIVNINGVYSLAISIATTVALLVGFFLLRRPGTAPR